MKTEEWMAWCVRRWLEEMGRADRRVRALEAELADLRARMEGVGAVRYDRDGSRTAWEDKMPALLDAMADAIDELERAWRAEVPPVAEARAIMAKTPERMILWLKYADGLTWYRTAEKAGYSVGGARIAARRAISGVYGELPEEWKRSPYRADDTK